MPNFTYNSDIPDAPNDPADDQPLMKVNTNSIASFVAVDHYGFNNNDGGTHQQSTYVSQSVAPGTTATQGAAYTKTVSGQVHLFYRRESNGDEIQLTASPSPLAATNGYTFLPGNLLLQWGVATAIWSGANNVTFPTAFSSAAYNVQFQPQRSASMDNRNFAVVGTISATQFTPRLVTRNNNNLNETRTIYWTAIGPA
jgi:hypothetical protein